MLSDKVILQDNIKLCIIVLITAGESGLVYKAYLNTAVGKELVAVKTGKGIGFNLLCLSLIFRVQNYFCLPHSNRLFTSW